MSNIKCPEKDCPYIGKTNSNLRMHLRFKHNKPYDGRAFIKCPEKDCDYETDSAFGERNMKSHMTQKHNIEAADDGTIVEITIKVKKR